MIKGNIFSLRQTKYNLVAKAKALAGLNRDLTPQEMQALEEIK